MNRIIPILALIVLLAIGGGFFLLTREKSEPQWTFAPVEKQRETYADREKKEQERVETETMLYNNALETKDITLCESITDPKLQNQCRDMMTISKALETKDITLCDGLSNTGMTLQCRDSVSYNRAETEKEAKYCQDINDENIRKGCEDTFAMKTMGTAIGSGSLSADTCDTFSSVDLQDQCRERLQTETDMRIYREAIDKEEIDRCDTIGEDNLRGQCRNALFLATALKGGNLELCASITDAEKADYCQKTLRARSDISRYQEAVRSLDLAACGTLTVAEIQHQCHDTIIFSQVRTTQDATLCDTLYNTGVIARCQSMVQK